MLSPNELTQVLYKIALDIGGSTDRQVMLRRSIKTMLRKLNGFAAVVLAKRDEGGRHRLEEVFVMPRNLRRNSSHASVVDRLIATAEGGLKSVDWFDPQVLRYGHAWVYRLGLPGYGIVILLTASPLDAIVYKSLRPVCGKLAEACIACEMAQALVHSQGCLRLAASVFENTDEGVIITNPEATFLEVNAAFVDITGYRRDEVIGHNTSMLQSGYHDELFYQGMWRSLKETGRWRGEIWNRRKDGSVYPALMTISSVLDESGQLSHYLGVLADISQLKRTQEQLDFLAHHDPLTDLTNRLLLMERLTQAIKHAERHGTTVAVIFLDLDYFKNINDSLGHPVGDELLQLVAAALTSAVRREDTVARVGGDEFVLVLGGLDGVEAAAKLVYPLRALFNKPFKLGHRMMRVTSSMGISLYPCNGRDPDTLLRNADAAMYRAKESGRNRYEFYTGELTHQALERMLMESSLRQALEKEQLYLRYEPQIDLHSGRVIGVEALLRWHHPELGLVPPGKFIPLAEESGLIHAIGEWVLHAACTQALCWLNKGIDFGRMAVNIAGPQIQIGGLLEVVSRVLAQTGLPADRLELEVTESFVMHQAELAIGELEALRALGVTLAIDDFGTGYSSLSYLKRLPFHKLKLDQSFVEDIPQDANDKAISAAVIALGISLELRVIAEGVETLEQAEFLKGHCCHEAQGFLYGRPMGDTDMERLVYARNKVGIIA